MSDEGFWAQLVSVTDVDSSPVLITNNKFVIGRNEDCDLSFGGNKLVSGRHCCIERTNDGKVWLCDTSTNGTLLNMKTKVSKGKRQPLLHGDEIYVVYKKNAQHENIGYVYQEKDQLESEMTQDYSFDADGTLSDETVNQLNESTTSDDSNKNKNVSAKRKIQPDSEDKEASGKKQKLQQPVPEKKESKVEDEAKASTSKNPPSIPQEDDMLVTLSCIICQEILHDCISLQPCMHSFCSGCYSEWMDKSDECPSCRMKVDRINKNHLVNNLVEAYLKAHPDLKRSEEDIKELDEKNKITRDMLYPDRAPTGIDSYSEGSDDEEDHDDDEDGENSGDNDGNLGNAATGGRGGLFGGLAWAANAVTNVFGNTGFHPGPLVPRCKQCPTYGAQPGILPQRPPPDPTDEDAKTFPTAPAYACGPNQNHVLCLCCMLPMPDRRNEYRDGGAVPPQRCTFCYRSFCHAYWGCDSLHCTGCIGKLKGRLVSDSLHCTGCIGKLKDLNFGKKCLTSFILDNAYESKVLKDYMASQDMSVKTLLGHCLAKVVTGEYTCINQEKLTFGINTPLCYACGFTMFKDLAYCYRKEIPNEDLPQDVTRRPDCYWGKNCRTQRNKPDHAQRFNHVCDQTRTT